MHIFFPLLYHKKVFIFGYPLMYIHTYVHMICECSSKYLIVGRALQRKEYQQFRWPTNFFFTSFFYPLRFFYNFVCKFDIFIFWYIYFTLLLQSSNISGRRVLLFHLFMFFRSIWVSKHLLCQPGLWHTTAFQFGPCRIMVLISDGRSENCERL